MPMTFKSDQDNSWRKCDVCGRYIAYEDLNRRMVEPDNAFGGEVWETYHKACAQPDDGRKR